jgi:hypothetical protein
MGNGESRAMTDDAIRTQRLKPEMKMYDMKVYMTVEGFESFCKLVTAYYKGNEEQGEQILLQPFAIRDFLQLVERSDLEAAKIMLECIQGGMKLDVRPPDECDVKRSNSLTKIPKYKPSSFEARAKKAE